MARAPDERYDKAYELFKGGMKLVEIASQLNLPEGTVRRWKSTHKWDSERSVKNSERSYKKKGGQPGNKNAVGNEGGAPARNDNAVKHGLFEKYLPQETLDIVNNMSLNPLDILWDQIQIAYAAIVRAQQIMHVTDKAEMIKELKKSKIKSSNKSTTKTNSESTEEEFEYEFQFSWDRQATFLKAQARAQGELRSLIKQYDDMLHKNWDLATEEQKQRINLIKAQADKITGNNQEIEDLSDTDGDIYGSD